jgi:hypothetical protein
MLLSCGLAASGFQAEREMRRCAKNRKSLQSSSSLTSALKFRRLSCLVKRVIEDERAKEVKEAKTVLDVSLAMVVVGAILFLPYPIWTWPQRVGADRRTVVHVRLDMRRLSYRCAQRHAPDRREESLNT